MVVVDVWGRVEGRDVEFFHGEGDTWTARFPSTVTGRYIIEIWARDDYGNVGYATAVVTLVAGQVTCFCACDDDYRITMMAPTWEAIEGDESVNVSMMDPLYDIDEEIDAYVITMEGCKA